MYYSEPSNKKFDNFAQYYLFERNVPKGLLSRKQIKEQGLRLKRNTPSPSCFFTFYTSGFRLPWAKDKPEISSTELKDFVHELANLGSVLDPHLDEYNAQIDRYCRLGYANFTNLYRRSDCEDASLPTECRRYRQACEQLYDLFFAGSDPLDYIVIRPKEVLNNEGEATVEKSKATWTQSKPSIDKHLTGEITVGLKRGSQSRWLIFDLDNHTALNDPDHFFRVQTLLRYLSKHFRLVAEVNPKDGSVKVWLYLDGFLTTDGCLEAIAFLRKELTDILPGLGNVEIYPDNPQFYLPLRPDKITVLDQVCPKNYKDVYDPEYFLDYLKGDQPFDADLVLEHVQAVLDKLPAKVVVAPEPASTSPKAKPRKAAKKAGTGQGPGPKYKNRCAYLLYHFLNEGQFEADTIGKFISPCLWYGFAKGWSREEAVGKVLDKLLAIEDKDNSNRLNGNIEELVRTDLEYTSKAIWFGSGYCPDRKESEAKWQVTVDAWAKKGFNPFVRGSFKDLSFAATSPVRLIFNADVLALLPELQELTGLDAENTKKFLERVLVWVECKSEMAYSKLGQFLASLGATAFQDKVAGIMKFLKENGILILVKKYTNVEGKRTGNFYICGPQICFSNTKHNTQTCIYSLSVFENGIGLFTEQEMEELKLENRRMMAEERFRQRWLWVHGPQRQAA